MGEIDGVRRTSTAEGNENEAAGVVPALDRDIPYPVHHRRIHDVDNPLGRALDAQAEGLGDLLDRRPRRKYIDRARPGEQSSRVESSEDDIRIGQGGAIAAEAVACR